MREPLRTRDAVTGLLLQKPQPFAELEENSRIAISVLQDDGWKVSRVGAELSVDFTLTARPIVGPGIEQQLAEAQLKFAALRSEALEIRLRQWLAAAYACGACSVLALLHVPVLITPLGAACVLIWHFRNYRTAKGATK